MTPDPTTTHTLAQVLGLLAVSAFCAVGTVVGMALQARRRRLSSSRHSVRRDRTTRQARSTR